MSAAPPEPDGEKDEAVADAQPEPAEEAPSRNDEKQRPAGATREGVTGLLIDRDRVLPGSPVFAYSTIHADTFIAGDSFAAASAALFQAGKCRPDLLSKLTAVFEPPGCMRPALGNLEADRLVCLRGAEGSGRMTLAIQVLRHRVNDDVWAIRPGTQVRELAPAGFKQNRGYFLCVGSGEEITEFEFERLRAMCDAQGCYIVLICPPGRVSIASHAVVDVTRPKADGLTLLQRHTNQRLSPDDHQDVEDLLQLPDVIEWCHGSHPLSDLDAVAAILTDVVRGRIDREGLARHLDLVSRDGMQAWFSERSPELRPLIITLTFFGGLPVQIVLELEDGLGIRLRKASGETAPRDLLAVSGRTSLGEASAHIAFEEHDDSYGTARTEVAEFSDRTWESTLGLLLRTEYPAIRAVLVSWLRDLAEHHDAHVRRRAALTLGSFARDSLASLIHQVIEPWARLEKRGDDWWKAVSALMVPLSTAETAPRVTRLLEQWAACDDPKLVFCAAMVYGIALASSNPDEALAGLARIARRDGQDGEDWLDEAAPGLIAMYLGGDRDAEVLAAVRRWSVSKKKTERKLALTTFVNIMSSVESWIDKASSPYRNDDTPITGKRQVWPSLLLDACRSTTSSDVIATTREALNKPEFSGAAISAIRGWFGRANDRPYLIRPLTNLMVALARTGPEADRLAHHLGMWAAKKPTCAAAKVRDALLRQPRQLLAK